MLLRPQAELKLREAMAVFGPERCFSHRNRRPIRPFASAARGLCELAKDEGRRTSKKRIARASRSSMVRKDKDICQISNGRSVLFFLAVQQKEPKRDPQVENHPGAQLTWSRFGGLSAEHGVHDVIQRCNSMSKPRYFPAHMTIDVRAAN